MSSNEHYWAEFWKTHGKENGAKSEQEQVLRTSNKVPIKADLWNFTLEELDKHINPDPKDRMLELCCGNGLISKHYSPRVASIVAVDVSEDLLRSIDRDAFPNIKPEVADIRALQYEQGRFDKIVIYAGIQYLTHAEATELLERASSWLNPGGVLFLGDIPNAHRKWNFYDSTERQAVYFDNLKQGRDIVGTWFEPDFFSNLGPYAGFSQSSFLDQHPDLIYAHFRFDFKFIK